VQAEDLALGSIQEIDLPSRYAAIHRPVHQAFDGMANAVYKPTNDTTNGRTQTTNCKLWRIGDDERLHL
jgi:hypothetical protein